MSTATVDASTRGLLEWLARRPRTYEETIEAWRTSCPRLSVWEDALAGGLVRVVRARGVPTSVSVTAAGQAALAGATPTRSSRAASS